MTLRAAQGDTPAEPLKLTRNAALIVGHFHAQGLQAGVHVTESGLAEALNVSRTPVRSALEQLTEKGVVAAAGPRRGYYIAASAETIRALASDNGAGDDEEALYLAIAQDFLAHRIPEQFTEADLLRHYSIARGLLSRVLQRMAGDRVIERTPGYGWRFEPMLKSIEAHDESYRFRMVIEPAALLEPGFALDPVWAERTRREHEATLAQPPQRVSMVRFFEMNADFHETLAACSGNIFFHRAMQQQNQIRRFQNYSWTYGDDRIATACKEHLAILDALEKGDSSWAATLMRRHLELASQLRPAPAEGGASDAVRPD